MKMRFLMSAGVALLVCAPAFAMEGGPAKASSAVPTQSKTSVIPYYGSPDPSVPPSASKTSVIPHYTASAAGSTRPSQSKTSPIPSYGTNS